MSFILGCLIPAFIIGFLARKAGFGTKESVFMALGMLIPIINLIILIYFVSTTWPIQVELASLRGETGVGTDADAQTLMSVALQSEGKGDFSEAIAKYEEIIQKFPATDFAKDAEISIRNMKDKAA
jgi:hypothetical protein